MKIDTDSPFRYNPDPDNADRKGEHVMKKLKMRRRNPVARAVRQLRPQKVVSAKAYKRRPKHKGHSEINRNDLFSFPVAA